MKVGLLYFSGTGATALIAGMIGTKLQKSGHVIELVRIKRNRQLDLQSYDLIGIGSPTYSFRAPRIVTNILRHSKLNKIPFFVFCTSGGMPGNTLRNLYDAVKNKVGRVLRRWQLQTCVHGCHKKIRLKIYPRDSEGIIKRNVTYLP